MKRPASYKEALVTKGATIGADATVICGHTLGEVCFIGAGTVVTKGVPDYGLVVGNPGRLKAACVRRAIRNSLKN